MKINEQEMSIEFNNVMRSATNINDVEKSVKANNLSFVNQNAKEAFVKIEKIEDLTNLHARGVDSAKKVLRLIANNI
jgi:hypothetical protein